MSFNKVCLFSHIILHFTFFIFYYLFCHDPDTTHDINMNNTDLNKILQLFFDKIAVLIKTVQQLQIQIVLMQFSTQISMNTHDKSEDNLEFQNDFKVTEFFTKSEKWFNFFMYKDIWKNLQLFVSKLWFKLWQNHDQYSTDEEKMNYIMSQLKKNAAWTMNSFYHVKIFINLDNFITLLKQTYDDASCEHTAMTKLKNLQQRNQKFTSFFFKFLDLIDKLDWNESVKVAVLW